nr:ribonuclease H-like domain, reverse transcriptase, RNA-dependent DNA polymerase [Tanacetum cinerariifolium]
MLVQVYVDDIIFGSTKKSWCDEFKELMKNRFQMSSMGELSFFLGLHVKQKEDVSSLVRINMFQVTPKTSHLQVVKRIFRDAYEKKLIQVLKIHTDDNVADLLTKDFDVSRWAVIAMVIIWDSFCSLE